MSECFEDGLKRQRRRGTDRRRFLMSCAAATGVLLAQDHPQTRPNEAKLSRIGVMTLSFDQVLKSGRRPDPQKGTLDILDLPQMVADRYGLHYVELQHYHFASTEPSYLREMRERLRKAKSHMNQICLELGELNISSPDRILRTETVDLTKQWIDHAVAVECPRVMLNPGTLAPEVRQPAIASLKEIAAYARTKKVFVTIENRGHGPAPPKPSWDVIVEVVKTADIHANPDTGNFPDDASRATGLRAMYPLTCGSSHVHYEPARFDEAHALAIAKETGYKGIFSIEATSANGPDPYASVQTIIDEIVKDI